MSIQLEDGILSDMLVADHYAGGPARAIDEFLRASDGRYAIDRRYCDYFGRNVTWNVHGYLRRQRVVALPFLRAQDCADFALQEYNYSRDLR